MNRQERRRQERLGVSKGSIMEQYRKDAYDEGYRNGMMTEVEITFNLLAYTLSYKTELSKEELKDLLHSVYDNIDAFRTGHLEPQDYDTICADLEKDGLTLSEILKTIN